MGRRSTQKFNATNTDRAGRNRWRIRRQLPLLTSSFHPTGLAPNSECLRGRRQHSPRDHIEIGCSPGSSSTRLLSFSKERLCRRKESMEAPFHETHVLTTVCDPDPSTNLWRTASFQLILQGIERVHTRLGLPVGGHELQQASSHISGVSCS